MQFCQKLLFLQNFFSDVSVQTIEWHSNSGKAVIGSAGVIHINLTVAFGIPQPQVRLNLFDFDKMQRFFQLVFSSINHLICCTALEVKDIV